MTDAKLDRSSRRQLKLDEKLGLLFVAACIAGIGVFFWVTAPSSTSWNEEVRLSSGTVVMVKRTASALLGGEIGGPGSIEEERITLEVIGNSTDKTPKLDTRLVPIILDRDSRTNEWFIVATFFTCEAWYELRRPRLPYAEFRIVNGQWVQFPLESSRIGMSSNLVSDFSFKGQGDLSLIAKSQMQLQGLAPKYLRVVDSWTTGC